MAEGFAHAHGGDVMDPASAGLAPLYSIPPLTLEVMEERNVKFRRQYSKGLDEVSHLRFDLVINMSGYPLPSPFEDRARIWYVEDPFGNSIEVYRRIRDQVEVEVARLIDELRGAHVR
jgi:protein-tyrosine-phosphatase